MDVKKMIFWQVVEGIFLFLLNIPLLYLCFWTIFTQPIGLEFTLMYFAIVIVVLIAVIYVVVAGIRKIYYRNNMQEFGVLYEQYIFNNHLSLVQELPLPRHYKKSDGHTSFVLKKGCPKEIICTKQNIQLFPERYVFYESGGLHQFIYVIDEYRKKSQVLIADGPGYQTSL